MTWLDSELLERKGRTSFLTTGIALFLGAVFFIPLLLAVARAIAQRGVPAEAPAMVALGFAPFLIWFVIGSLRGFR